MKTHPFGAGFLDGGYDSKIREKRQPLALRVIPGRSSAPDAGRRPAHICYLASCELHSEDVPDIRFSITYFIQVDLVAMYIMASSICHGELVWIKK